jgi:DNA-binding transcriptional MerR regulator
MNLREVSSMNAQAKSPNAFRTISEVAEDLGVQQHVLRFWETKFASIKPLKRGGGRRYYRPEDVALIKRIHALLYTEGYTIKGVQKLLKGVSKSTVLEEQRRTEPHIHGDNVPRIEGVGIDSNIQTSSVTITKLILSDEQKQSLRVILNDLNEIRELLIDDESDETSSYNVA